jgi:dipeptidyl aminopeptidase/acylaminoacyl peptidase
MPVVVEDPGAKREGFYLYARQQRLWPREVVGKDPITEPRIFDPPCPLRNITKAYPPTLLLHGDNDTDVPFQQSVLMAEELERHGVEYEFIAMAGRGHGFDAEMSDPVIASTFERVLTFLRKQLRP